MSRPPRASRTSATFESWLATSLSVAALVSLGLVFTLADLAVQLSTSATALLVVLALGLLFSLPLFFGGRRSIHQLLIAVAVYGIFAAWIVTLPRIDWDVAKPFVRAFHQIHPGMTRADVEVVMRREFLGKKAPTPTWKAQTGHYILDPDDGAFNAEILFLQMTDGRVTSVEYLMD